MVAVSGLAASIRNTVDSETFDLAGHSASSIEKIVHDAFSEPFPLSEMIRITLITGAGKLGRQKYDDNAGQAVTQTLRSCGFDEDRGASAIMECAGTYKLQHDTGKNLKTVVVFPKVNPSSSAGVNGLADQVGGLVVSLLPDKSPQQKIAMASLPVFERMLTSMCPTWTQKKGCVKALEEIATILKDLEHRLMQGAPLNDSEQEFYDSVSASVLEEKLTFAKEQMHKHVEEGRITVDERKQLLEQVSDRIKSLTSDIAEAKSENKAKRVENLTAAKTKAEERKAKLEQIVGKGPYPLKNEAEIAKLRKELGPLLDIEEAAKGRLLTLKESQAVGRKDDMLSEIAQLEESSRGWFEPDDMFEARVQASRAAWKAQRTAQKKKMNKSGGTGGVGRPAATTTATKWVIPAAAKKKPAASKPKASGGGGGVFAAMMMDSDSD